MKKIDVPTPIIHRDDDQMVPIDASAKRMSTMIKDSTLKVYPGASHGLSATHEDQVNEDLLNFLKSKK